MSAVSLPSRVLGRKIKLAQFLVKMYYWAYWGGGYGGCCPPLLLLPGYACRAADPSSIAGGQFRTDKVVMDVVSCLFGAGTVGLDGS